LQDQYITVYEALLEALTASAIDKEQFCEHLENQQNKPIAKNQTLLWLEFQVQDNNMIPHLKRKTQLSQSLYDDNFFQQIIKYKKNTTPSEQS
jgi:hypothetical protein